MGLVKSPLAESVLDTNYEVDEQKIINMSVEIGRLIENLGRNKDESEKKK